jgi:SNF2 family DNA or RNA helicase
VLICNYEGIWRAPLGDWILKQQLDTVVLDEAHRIKASGSTVSKFFAKFQDNSRKRICLSGTPLHNSPLDIYGQARFLDPSFFGTSFSNFRARYAIMGGYGGHEVRGYQRQDEFYRIFRNFTFSVGKDEVLKDIPEMVFMERYCTLTKDEMETYKILETAFIAEVQGEMVTAQNAMVKLLRLQQVTSGYVRTDEGNDKQVGASKETLLAEVIDDIDKGEPVVVFCRFLHDLEAVHRVAKSLGRRSYELSGARKELQAWQECTAGGEVMAVQIQSGGVGVDMSRARYVIDYSLSFSYGDWEQSRSRLRRPGQTRQTVSIALLADKTVDGKVWAALQKKKDVIEDILTGYKGERP